MASSEKAGALKDAFVNAIANDLGGEAMAKAGAMENAKLAGKLGLDVGDQASIMIRPSGAEYYDDGDPSIYINPELSGIAGTKKLRSSPEAANPGGILGTYVSKDLKNQLGEGRSPMALMKRQELFNKSHGGVNRWGVPVASYMN